jgi:hypothetical protein
MDGTWTFRNGSEMELRSAIGEGEHRVARASRPYLGFEFWVLSFGFKSVSLLLDETEKTGGRPVPLKLI